MWDKDASAACLEEVSQLIKNSDANGLVAAFSEKARSTNPHLDSQANSFMNLLGGGTIDKDPSILLFQRKLRQDHRQRSSQ